MTTAEGNRKLYQGAGSDYAKPISVGGLGAYTLDVSCPCNRSEYMGVFVFSILAPVTISGIFALCYFIIESLTGIDLYTVFSALSALAALFIFVMLFTATMRRLSDAGRPALLAVLLLVPVIGLVLVIYLFFAPERPEAEYQAMAR